MTSPTTLHVTIHAYPDASPPRRDVKLRGRIVPALEVTSDRFHQPLPVTFDHVLSALERLPRLFIEPDGSFIWIGPTGPDEWKFDGQLHDSTGGLMTMELKVSGHNPDWDQLLSCLNWPETRLAFELVREGVYLDESGLRSLVS